MLILYNTVQLLFLLILGPMLGGWVLASSKYRARIPRRLGCGLSATVRGLRSGPRVWVHALSVGEVASARPLLKALRQEMPELVIILSTTTRGGEEYARGLAGTIDSLIPSPLDCYWTVGHFLSVLRPDLFILVETDFWPNLLLRLQAEGVPALLVNGRITRHSMAWYQRCRLIFAPLFKSFTRITMQMVSDADCLVQLGVTRERIAVCGNLKYDMIDPVAGGPGAAFDLGGCGLAGRPLLVAGSTHAGEEEILLDTFVDLAANYPDLALVVAPRSIARASEVVALGASRGLRCALRTAQGRGGPCQVLVLDTLGELAQVYKVADLAFVGGSLVAEGGHNPLEPACFAVPVLFGPDMSDFAEISRDLQEAGGAEVVTGETIHNRVAALLGHEERRQAMGRAAIGLVRRHQGAAGRHLGLIREVMRLGQ